MTPSATSWSSVFTPCRGWRDARRRSVSDLRRRTSSAVRFVLAAIPGVQSVSSFLLGCFLAVKNAFARKSLPSFGDQLALVLGPVVVLLCKRVVTVISLEY